jgi:gluconokinase
MATVLRDRAELPFILSLDIGTSSVRAAIFDRLGQAVEGLEARRPHEIGTTKDGSSETDADALLERVWRCIDEVLCRMGHLKDQIRGVGICTFVGNILGVDGDQRAITPLTTYADTRSEGEVAKLRAEFDEMVVHDRTGCHFHPAYLPAFFRWFARNQKELFHRVSRWVSIGEYLEVKLFGDAAVSFSVASWSGLLDRHKLAWDEPLLNAMPVQVEQLSRLTDSNIPRQGLNPRFATRWPTLRDLPWFPALGDGATANVGSGCVSSGRVALTVGTTTAMRAVVDHSIGHIPSGLWCYRVDGRRSLPGGALSEGGSVFAWMKDVLQLGDPVGIEKTLSSMEPDAHGLTVLPFLAGERSPGLAGHARGTVHGLSLATTSLDILRAGLESVAYRIGLVFELLQQLMPMDPQIVASGGALLGSPTWLHIMTDVLNRPVAVSEVQEASGRGAALLVLEALGVLPGLEEAPAFIGRIHYPDERRHKRYREAMERQRNLYEKLVKTSSDIV